VDIKKMQYFIAIAEEKSISQAAKRLYISQPALTQFLHSLENEVGTKLFERIGNRFNPTTAGKIYLRGAYSIVAIQRETYNQISESKNGGMGEFTVSLSHSQNVHRIHYLFLKMKQQFPNIRFQVLERSSEQGPEAVASGMADIGIISQNFHTYQLNTIPLWKDYPLLVTNGHNNLDAFAHPSPEHPFPVVSLPDIAGRTFISMTHTSHVRQVCDELFQAYRIRPNLVFECPFVSSLLQILEQTDYTAIVPMGLLNYDPKYRYYCIECAASWDVMAIYRNNMPLLEHHTYFIDIMKQVPLLK